MLTLYHILHFNKILQYLLILPQHPLTQLIHVRHLFFSPHSDYHAQLNNASWDGRDTEVIDLLRKGADPNYYYPLHWACHRNHPHTAVTLIQWGADVRRRDDDVYGWTPLHYACDNNCMACVKVCLEHHSPTGEPGCVCSCV